VLNVFTTEGASRKAQLLLTFLAGQGTAQALNLFMGLAVLHWLDVGSYAKYGLTYGFQSTANILTDLGFSATIIALVGHRIADRRVIGDYVRAGRQLRLRMLVAVIPVAGIAFVLITRRLGWTVPTQIGLLLSIFISIYFSGLQAYYGAPLIVSRRLGTYYRVQVGVSLARLAGCAILHAAGHLGAMSAVWVNAAGMVAAGLAYRVTSRQLIDEPRRPNPSTTRQMLRYVMPNIPGVVFYALQGQLSLFLIAILGHAKGVAQVSALARLGQLSFLLYAFNGVVVEPWLARSHEKQVLPKYLLVFGAAVCFSVLFVGFSLVCPRYLLWILGKNYQNLDLELAWTVASVCVGYFTALTWTAISARRLLYWTSTFLNIGLIVAAQVAFILLAGVQTTLQAVQFGFVSVLASFIAQCINLTYGLKKGPRVALAVEEEATYLPLNETALIS